MTPLEPAVAALLVPFAPPKPPQSCALVRELQAPLRQSAKVMASIEGLCENICRLLQLNLGNDATTITAFEYFNFLSVSQRRRACQGQSLGRTQSVR
jgi:hypothetical protein